MEKNWRNLPSINQKFIDKFPEVNNIVLQLLSNRGLTAQDDIDDFLYPNYDDHIYDPFLFKQMAVAVERLFKAIRHREKLMVYGDYDADGVCSTVILYSALKGLGLDVDVYIPFRESEGYGLNKEVAQRIIDQKFNLVFTVDCGVANAAEIKTLKDAGIETIVLDHHQEPMARPEALAIINPALDDSGYPFSGLAGAGVVFKFVQAILIKQEAENSPIKLPAGFDKWLLDIVAIATVGDLVPLVKENRVFVKYGLMVLEKTKRPGLRKIIEAINNHRILDTQFIGWRLVPRLNAAGRIDHASSSFNLLIAQKEEDIDKLVSALEESNKKRQQITEKILNEAILQIGEPADEKKILWAVGENWPAGVVGLVAGRLTDMFYRPALVISKESNNDSKSIKYVGSGRSIDEFNITDALKQCEKFLLRFGGHSQACGFTVIGEENFKQFQEKLNQIAAAGLANVDLKPILEIEAEVKLIDINWGLWEDMEKFEPFGEGNLKPRLVSYNLKIEQIQAVGNEGKHMRVMVTQDDNPNLHKLIGFSFGEWCAKLNIGDKIDIVFELDLNEWNGNRELQLKIIDLKMSRL
ncbi:MAG: single-stranded-DNA-specific exonuclease RecJ [Patescibacteria group bacterium]